VNCHRNPEDRNPDEAKAASNTLTDGGALVTQRKLVVKA